MRTVQSSQNPAGEGEGGLGPALGAAPAPGRPRPRPRPQPRPRPHTHTTARSSRCSSRSPRSSAPSRTRRAGCSPPGSTREPAADRAGRDGVGGGAGGSPAHRAIATQPRDITIEPSPRTCAATRARGEARGRRCRENTRDYRDTPRGRDLSRQRGTCCCCRPRSAAQAPPPPPPGRSMAPPTGPRGLRPAPPPRPGAAAAPRPPPSRPGPAPPPPSAPGRGSRLCRHPQPIGTPAAPSGQWAPRCPPISGGRAAPLTPNNRDKGSEARPPRVTGRRGSQWETELRLPARD